MSDQASRPIDWFVLWDTDIYTLKSVLLHYCLLDDPAVISVARDGRTFLKMTYSGFQDCSDYSGVVVKARELASSLTGMLRIRQDPPGNLVLHRVVGMLPDGTEQKAPWVDSVSFGTRLAVDGPPEITIEQRLVEYTIRSKDGLAMDVLRFLSEEPTFQGLFKAVEVIRWDLGGGSLTRGYKNIIDRKWITKELLDDFSYTANKVERHWDNLKPMARMDLQEARTLLGSVIEQWIAERAKLQVSVPRRGKMP